MFPRATSSMESAITSRLTSDIFMPSVPMVMPSEMETVLNSIGVPPAAVIPAFTCSATCRRWKLQGPTSIHVFATPIIGRRSFSSSKPTAFSMARAGARSGPLVIAQLCRLPRFPLPVSCANVLPSRSKSRPIN